MVSSWPLISLSMVYVATKRHRANSIQDYCSDSHSLERFQDRRAHRAEEVYPGGGLHLPEHCHDGRHVVIWMVSEDESHRIASRPV